MTAKRSSGHRGKECLWVMLAVLEAPEGQDCPLERLNELLLMAVTGA